MEDTVTNDLPVDNAVKKKDPGAMRLGNFINYYQFHPPEDRIKYFPKDIWPQMQESKLVCLDIGCNTGDLTQEVFNNISLSLSNSGGSQSQCFILGIDIDPILISRAEKSNKYKNFVTYKTFDIMSDISKPLLKEYLRNHNKEKFNAIFCFSVTMWIHLNHGDEGLKKFLSDICHLTDLLIIEPQPWKCYLNAVKRLKKGNQSFPKINELRMNRRVDSNIENIIQNKYHFQKIYEASPNSWGRKIISYKKAGKTPSICPCL